MNTAIEADDTNPQLREHARNAMNELHRMIGGVVKRGVEANELDASVDPYALASIMTASLEGALMLSKLFDDPVHMERVVEHLTAQIEALPSARTAARTKKPER